jgi:hypothetical protein
MLARNAHAQLRVLNTLLCSNIPRCLVRLSSISFTDTHPHTRKHTHRYAYCLLFATALVNPANGVQEHDLVYYERLSFGVATTSIPVASVTTIAPVATAPPTPPNDFYPPVSGSAAQWGEVHDCVATLSQCLNMCRASSVCVGVDYSATAAVCVVLTRLPVSAPDPSTMSGGSNFWHYARRSAVVGGSASVSTVSMLSSLDVFGSGVLSTSGGTPALLLDGTEGTFAQVPVNHTGASVRAVVAFRQRPTDGAFGYVFCKSDASGNVRSFAVGVKTVGASSEVRAH